jgi:probable phosphoglycerate mutase
MLRSRAAYPPLQLDDRLQEVSIGSWDGLTHVDIDACWPSLLDGTSPFDWFFKSPDGESYESAVERVRGWLEGLNGTVIAVSHVLLGRIIRGAYPGLPKEQAPQLPVPPDVIWHLYSGKVDALAIG